MPCQGRPLQATQASGVSILHADSSASNCFVVGLKNVVPCSCSEAYCKFSNNSSPERGWLDASCSPTAQLAPSAASISEEATTGAPHYLAIPQNR
jgi:hypothetical protein